MDFPTRKYERGSNWSEQEVVELLQFWSDEAVQTELESCLRNQHVFNRIAEALHRRGIYRTADQCREKIKKLKLDYRRMKETQQAPRGARAHKFYDVIDRVMSGRPVASSSSSYTALWGTNSLHQTLPGSSSSSFTFSCPPKPGELLEIKLEELNADGEEELLSAEEPLCSDEDELEVDYKVAGGDMEELGESARGEGGEGAGRSGWSPSGTAEHIGLSDINVTGSSCAGASPAAVPTPIIERATQADLADPKPSSKLHQRKRRRPLQMGASGRLLEKALASFMSWQRVMEERYISLEETRLQQEARAEEQRMQQEERRVRLEREHELRIISLLTGVLTAGRGTVEQGISNTMTSVLSAAAVSESASLTVPNRLSDDPPTFSALSHTLHVEQGSNSTKAFDSNTTLSESTSLSLPSGTPTLPSVPQMLQRDETLDQESTSTTASDFNSTVSESALLTLPLSSQYSAQKPLSLKQTLSFGPSMLLGNQTPQYSNFLSCRGNRIRQHQGILQEGFSLYYANIYDETNNPDGIINLGTSENKLCFDLLLNRLTQRDMLSVEPSLLQYADTNGHHFFRDELTKFLSEHCHSPRPLRTDSVVVMNSCASIFSALAAVLCDPDDAILISSPFYGGITEDIDLYSGVKLYCVPLSSEPSQNDERPFQLTAEKLEHALQGAKKEGVNVKAVILINPHNPVGDIYTADEMASFLEFAKKHELHVIVDEIYMLSVFDGSFNSVLSLQRLPDPQRTHVMWGLSKDFAMPGMCVGTLYSENVDVLQALSQLSSVHAVPGLIQHQVAQLLRDKDWTNKVFFPENRRRLQEAHRYVSSQLIRFGIPYLHRGAGLYIWADFSKYLREKTFQEELHMWRCFLKHRVLLSCGQAFSCSSPGWFRIVFSEQHHRLQLGLKRFGEALEELQGSTVLANCENINGDKQQDDAPILSTTMTENKKDTNNCKDTTMKAFNTPTKMHSDQNVSVPESLLLASEDIVGSNCQSFSNSGSLDSLLSVLRKQINTSDWLEKNKPKLDAGEDPTQEAVFKDLLDRARI